MIKPFFSILLLILMFGAIVYSLFSSGSSIYMLGFGIFIVLFIMRSGQGITFWSRWVSAFPSSNETSISEDIKIELASSPINQRENKRDSILAILCFHKILFNTVFVLFFAIILVSFFLLIEYEGLFHRSYLVCSIVVFLLGLWWWCKKTYPSEQRNDINYSHRILSLSDWEESPIFKGLEQISEKTRGIPKTFEDYWISNEVSLDFIITSINKEQVYFEYNTGKWLLVQGQRGNSYQRNLAGFVKALIELKYLKTSLCSREAAQHLKEVFVINENDSGTELQQFSGANFQNLNREYVEFFKEKLREISTKSTPKSL